MKLSGIWCRLLAGKTGWEFDGIMESMSPECDELSASQAVGVTGVWLIPRQTGAVQVFIIAFGTSTKYLKCFTN
jgi:hypothetical protein